MNKNRFLRMGLGVLIGMILMTGCRVPKHLKYASPAGDFTCDIPSGWSIIRDAAGSDYVNITFTGPFEPSFFRGVPSMSVRWYRANAPHRLPGGSYETYSGYEDFVRQMMRDVYGPDGKMWAGDDRALAEALARNETLPEFNRVKVSGWEAYYFVVYREMAAPQGPIFGVMRNDKGERVVLQRHAYVLLPMEGGFYALIYPSTREGFERYKTDFFRLVKTFHPIKDGPAGPTIAYSDKEAKRT